MPPKKRKPVKGGKKKEKKVSNIAVAVSAADTPIRPSYGFTRLKLMSASFVTHPKWPCHFETVVSCATTVQHLSCLINERNGGTLHNIVVFQGEVKGGDVWQTSDGPLEADVSLHQVGIEGALTPQDVNSCEPSVLYYDYQPEASNSSLVTSDEYFLDRVLVATSRALK